jgi:hypothetical protein
MTTDAQRAYVLSVTTCNRCSAQPWFSISQPSQETAQCGDAKIELFACKRHLAAVVTQDIDHEWEPQEVHLLLWTDEIRREELALFGTANERPGAVREP